MSAYGSANTVAVVPYIASQEFRESLRQQMPQCLQVEPNQPLTSQSAQARITSASQRGLLSASQAARCTAVIGGLQRSEVARAAATTLAEMGFQVRHSDGPTSSLWAEREQHQVMALEVHDGGGFAFDLAGLDDGACHEILTAFQRGMAERGITYQAVSHTHNDPRGGQLIRRVRSATSTRRVPGRISRQAQRH